MKQDNFVRNAIIIFVAFILSLFIINAVVGPLYNVWEQSQTGRAELARAESNRQIAVLEAQAKLDSATLQAKAEVERAKGAASANKILGESLKGNSEYLQYLYIQNLENSDNSKEKTVIYVPTERGIPIPITESQRLKQN